jgi:hypothetical protein
MLKGWKRKRKNGSAVGEEMYDDVAVIGVSPMSFTDSLPVVRSTDQAANEGGKAQLVV